jgi:hypothetical protein
MAESFGKRISLRTGQWPIGSALVELLSLPDEAEPRPPKNGALSPAAGDPNMWSDRSSCKPRSGFACSAFGFRFGVRTSSQSRVSVSRPPQFHFGSALFSVVVFRHLPELGRDTDGLLMARRGFLFVGLPVRAVCTSLEVERLGRAFGGNRN